MDQITDYDSLQAAVAGTLHRTGDSDIEDNCPLWIQLLEAELNDRLLLKDMESEEDITLSTGVNYVALPTGFVSPIALWLIIDSYRTDPLRMVLPQQLDYDGSNSIPAEYAIDGSNIRFDCPAADNYAGKFRMVKKSNLSDSNTSNALLLKRPDVYLWGTLKWACSFAEDDAGMAKYSALMERAIDGLKNANKRSQDVLLTTDIGVSGRSNIYLGE